MLNMNFSERIVIATAREPWQQSPLAGVWRKPLAREGKEHGHATSIVRYEPGARFREHGHPKGEEIFVLEGVFSDQRGDFPAGSYLRNPPGYHHAPFSESGCTLFVKLCQFSDGDTAQVAIDTRTANWQAGRPPLQVLPLHSHGTEHVALVRWPAGAIFPTHTHPGGEEILVLEGCLYDEEGEYQTGTWLRNPPYSRHAPYAKSDTLIWVKTGHL